MRIRMDHFDNRETGRIAVDRENGQKTALLHYWLVAMRGSYPGQIFTRSQLLDDVWGYVSESGEDTVKTHVSRLRNRLRDVEDFRIITVKGLGYKAELAKEETQ